MNDFSRAAQNDATTPQRHGALRFSWSGFCKDGMMRRYAFILAHADGKQPTRKTKIPRPGNTSRRIEWRNSPLCQRFWCPSFRPPVQRRLPSLSTLSRSQLRFMSSRHRPKANTTEITPGQGVGSAPTLLVVARRIGCFLQRRSQSDARSAKFLWSSFPAYASVISWRGSICRVRSVLERGALSDPPVRLANWSFTCLKSLSCWPLALLSRCQPVPARRPRPSPSMLPRSWSSQLQAKANIVEFLTGQAPAPDPCFARPVFVARRQSC